MENIYRNIYFCLVEELEIMEGRIRKHRNREETKTPLYNFLKNCLRRTREYGS